MSPENIDPQELPPPPAGYKVTSELPPPPAGYKVTEDSGTMQEPIGYRNGIPVFSIDVYGRAGPPPQPPVFQGMDAEGKPIIASPPGPPPSPIPYDLQTLHQQKETTPTRLNPRTGLPMTPLPMGTVPLLDLPYTQGKEVIGGFERMAEPFGGMRSPADAYTPGGMEVAKGGGREQAGAASQIIRGTIGALTPLLPGALIAAPVATAATLGAYTALGSGTEAGLNWAGVKPEYSALVSDLVSLYGAHRTLKWMGKIANLPYDREAASIKQRLDAAMEQANDPNATPMDRAAAKARVGALMDGLKEAEAGSPGGYFFPQVSIGRTPGTPWVKNQLNPIEQSSQDFLRERGIDTPLSMQTGSPQAADLEGAVRRSTGGGFAAAQGKRTLGQVQELGPREFANIGPEVSPEEAGAAVRGKLAGDLEQQRKALVDQVAPVATTPELAGAKVLEKGKQTIRQFDQAADEAYKAAWVAEKDPRNIRRVPTYDKNGREILDEEGSPVTEAMALPVDVTDVAEKLKPIADKYERTLSDTDARASLGLKAMRNFILDAKQYPKRPLSAVETDLGMFKEAARNENIPELRDESQGLAAASVKALQAKIDATMAQAKYPGWDGTGTSPALRHLQSGRLNTARKYEVADIYKPFGRNIEDVEPVSAFKRMTWSGDAGIQHLRNVATIAPEHMPEVGRAFIDNGGKWGMLGPETKKVLFKDPELIKNLDEYFAKHEKFGGLTEMNPVDLFNKLTAPGGKPNELLADVKQHAPEQMPGLFRAFVGELWDRSTREGNIQKVQSTLDEYLNMDPKTKALMVDDPQTVRNLDNLFFSLKRLNKEVNSSGSGYIVALNAMKSKLLSGAGITAGSLLGYSHGGPGQAGAGVGLGIMAGVGAEALVNKGLARVLFDPKLNKLLTQGIKFQLQGNNEGARLIGESLSRRLSGEQPPPEGQPPTGGGPPSTPPEGGGGAAPAEGPGPRQKIKEGLKKFWEDEEGSLTLRNLRKADRAAGSEQSTRVPTAVKATEDPLSNILTTGYKSWMQDPEMLRKNVNAMLDYPNFRDLQAQVKSGALSIPDAAEHIIGRIQENLQWLHDSMPANFRDRARLWYDGAHTIARKWAGDYGATPEQVAASMAVTSPGTDWFVNAERARRLLEFWQDRGSKAWDPRMAETWRDKVGQAVKQKDVYSKIQGKSFNDVVAQNPHLAPIWFRLYDEAVNPREYPTLTPEGKAGDLARIGSGDPRQFSWSDFGQIKKVLSILEDGSRENIHQNLGQEHKVRNFYNNIINPDSPREHTTIDTHAVAAGLVRPLSQMSTEVGHNFGGTGSSSSSVSGENGTYGLHKEAYRRVAAANGLLPREMQSITWEAIRSMFSPQFKGNRANVEYINSLWQDVSSGKITADAARQRALQYAGGFDQPSWFKGRWSPAIPKGGRNPSKSR